MHDRHAARALRRARPALAAMLALALVGLTQCRAVGDRMTGLARGAGTLSARSSCMRACNDGFKTELRAEQSRFVLAKRACGWSLSCRKDEDLTHQQNLQLIEHAKKLCKRSCYNEGAGNTGA
jgi:hypothetical protein